MDVENRVILLRSRVPLQHVEVVRDLSKHRIVFDKRAHVHALRPIEVDKGSQNTAHSTDTELERHVFFPFKESLQDLHLIVVQSLAFSVSAEHAQYVEVQSLPP